MDRIVYMEKLFSRRREKLIDKCLELQRQGKRFLYIMPSSAAIFQVRNRFFEASKGFLGSRVIVFDDLEMDIVKNFIDMNPIIYDPIDRVIISEICSRIRGELKYYGYIYDKRGFHQEISAFIRTLKRSFINEEELFGVLNRADDEVMMNKLHDLYHIYREYNRTLRSNKIYDRNDISIMAVDLVEKYNEFEKIDTIIIDGFTDIEKVSMELIRKIAQISNLNIYVNCPYENNSMKGFLKNEIEIPFERMGFKILREDKEIYDVSAWIREICEKFYSGERVETNTCEISITKYSCIESEVRETARNIKERLLNGENPGEIAVYINNKEDYSEVIYDIFKEFNIPLSMKYEIPLGDFELVRGIIKAVEYGDEESLKADKWVELLNAEIDNKKGYMMELIKRTLNDDLNLLDKYELKAFDALTRLVEETKISIENTSLLSGATCREYFMEYILDGIISAKVAIDQGNDGGVKVIGTAQAKGIYYDHIYILGLNEGEIPEITKNNGLFDEWEVSHLSKYGIKYRDPLWELNREKIRFNLSLASARKSITLSYRGADEGGKFAIASPFIDEIKYLCGIDKINERSMRERFQLKFENVMSDNELKQIYIKNYFEGKYKGAGFEETAGSKEFVQYHSKDIKEIIECGNIEYHREMEKEFNQFEGILGENFIEIADILCKFTPSALNMYLNCPFKYLVAQLYQPGEHEEDSEELSNMEIGEFYHSVLYKYYSRVKQFKNIDEELYLEAFNDTFSDLRVLDASPEDGERIKHELYDTIYNFITLDIERINDFEKNTKGNILRPLFLERIIENNSEFGVDIKCKVDRVDVEYVCSGNKMIPTGRYVIYDYKKSSINGINEILNNKDYQLPIYYFLIEGELMEKLNTKALQPMALLYLSIEKSDKRIELDGIYITEYKKILGINKKGDINSEHFKPLMDYLKGLILETIALIKNGRFNPKPMCSNFEGYSIYKCEFEKLCRYSRNKMKKLVEANYEK